MIRTNKINSLTNKFENKRLFNGPLCYILRPNNKPFACILNEFQINIRTIPSTVPMNRNAIIILKPLIMTISFTLAASFSHKSSINRWGLMRYCFVRLNSMPIMQSSRLGWRIIFFLHHLFLVLCSCQWTRHIEYVVGT